MPRSSAQLKIDRYFPSSPIAYQPCLVLLFGPATGIFLYQLLYWDQKGSNKAGWVYKTEKDFRKETGLSKSNQETAIRKLIELELIDYKKAQIPQKRHFRVRIDNLCSLIPKMLEKRGISYLKYDLNLCQNGTSNSMDSVELLHKTTHEITQETTAKNTGNSVIFDKNSFKSEKDKLMGKMDISEINSNDFDRKVYDAS